MLTRHVLKMFFSYKETKIHLIPQTYIAHTYNTHYRPVNRIAYRKGTLVYAQDNYMNLSK